MSVVFLHSLFVIEPSCIEGGVRDTNRTKEGWIGSITPIVENREVKQQGAMGVTIEQSLFCSCNYANCQFSTFNLKEHIFNWPRSDAQWLGEHVTDIKKSRWGDGTLADLVAPPPSPSNFFWTHVAPDQLVISPAYPCYVHNQSTSHYFSLILHTSLISLSNTYTQTHIHKHIYTGTYTWTHMLNIQ